MVQFNLLPDVKLEYLKAEHTKRLAFGISGLLTIIVIVIVGILFSITAFQKSKINSLTADIRQQGSTINTHPDLDQILTIQNQINTLEGLHQQEPATDRLAGYLNQLIPVNVNISSFNIDFNAHTITMDGTADSLATVNQLVDTLKFAKYSVKGQTGQTNAFSSVVLTSFGIVQSSSGSSASGSQASYSINFNFDPTLFNNVDTVKMIIPNKVTTRSQLDQPTQLFKLAPSSPKGGL